MATADSGRTQLVNGTVLTRGSRSKVYHDPEEPCDSALRASNLREVDVALLPNRRPCSHCFDVDGKNEPSRTQASGCFSECPHCGADLDGVPLGGHMARSCPKADVSQSTFDDLPALEDAPDVDELEN